MNQTVPILKANVTSDFLAEDILELKDFPMACESCEVLLLVESATMNC